MGDFRRVETLNDLREVCSRVGVDLEVWRRQDSGPFLDYGAFWSCRKVFDNNGFGCGDGLEECRGCPAEPKLLVVYHNGYLHAEWQAIHQGLLALQDAGKIDVLEARDFRACDSETCRCETHDRWVFDWARVEALQR